MGDVPHWFDLSFGVIISLTATIFIGTCTVFLMFIKSLENKTDQAIDSLGKTTIHFTEKFDEIAESVNKVSTDLRVLVERSSIHEKRLDRLDLKRVRSDS